jgi:methylamine dehydrogenase heavy chain
LKYILIFAFLLSTSAHAELKPEPIPVFEKLPTEYPSSWLYAHDANFYSLVTGRIIIVDVAADTKEYKGSIGAAQFGAFISAKNSNRLYVAESFYSRGTTGVKTDVVSIYEKETLNKVGEVILPNNKRAQIVTNKNVLRLVNNDRFLLVFSFTPASSVIVVDTQEQKVLGEIATPGCSMIYPTDRLAFSSLCADGSMLSIHIDEKGLEKSRTMIPPFFDVDKDPLFDKPIYTDEKIYFASYLGKMHPVNILGKEPVPEAAWDLLSKKEREQNWRPGGWQIMSTNGSNEMLIIMHKDGYNGSHKFGGEEIWVYDLKTAKKKT